jgi:hypothetical protein
LLEPQFTKFTADEKDRLLSNKLQGTRRRKSELQVIEEVKQHTLLKDELTAEDWKVLHQYKDLLEPCWVATMDLQGRPGDSKTCSLTNVMLDIEYLVQFLTDEHAKYRDAATDTIEGEWHFVTQLKLALDKAEEYFAKLDESPAYAASVILHPRYNMKYLEAQWSNKPQWLESAKEAVQDLWERHYKEQPISVAISPKKAPNSSRRLNCVEEYRERGIAKANEAVVTRAVTDDEFDRYCKQDRVETHAPIEWWQTTGYSLYPRLAQMAIDILSIPPMSDEPERIFSRLGEMITKRRNRLNQDIIQATTCLYSWDKEGLIDIRRPTPKCI